MNGHNGQRRATKCPYPACGRRRGGAESADRLGDRAVGHLDRPVSTKYNNVGTGRRFSRTGVLRVWSGWQSVGPAAGPSLLDSRVGGQSTVATAAIAAMSSAMVFTVVSILGMSIPNRFFGDHM